MTPEQQQILDRVRARRQSGGSGMTPEQQQILERVRARRSATPAQPYDGNAPDALPVPGTFDAKPPVQKTFNDQVLDAVGYGARTGAIVLDRMGQGAATLAGIPVDIINSAPVVAGWVTGKPGQPIADKPFFGGDHLRSTMRGFGFSKENALEPTDAFQSIAGRVGEEIGANLVPVLGQSAAAARLGREGAKQLSPILRHFIEPYTINPGRMAGKEIAAAAAAGSGAGIANQVVDRNTTGGQIADLAGALAGVGAYGVAGAAGRAGKQVLDAVTGNPNYVDQVVKDVVVNDLVNSSTRIAPRAVGDVPDTDPLVRAILQSGDTPRVSEVIPGYKESLADLTRDPGLANLEYGMQSRGGATSSMFMNRRSANNQAVDAAMQSAAPTESPGAFRSALESQRDIQLRAASDQTAGAQDSFDEIIRRLVAASSAEERGATIRTGLESARDAANTNVRNAWESVPPASVMPDPLAEALDRTYGGLTTARQQAVSNVKPAIDIPAGLTNADNPTPVNIKEFVDQRSALDAARRDAISTGDTNRAEALSRFISEIDAYMTSDAVPTDVVDATSAARAATRDFHERFTRPNDPIADVLARQEGRPNVPDSAVGRRFVQPDSAQASNIDRLLAETDATGASAGVRSAVRDELLAGLDKAKALGDPRRIDDYLKNYNYAFERFPDLRADVAEAAARGRTLAEVKDAEIALQRDIGTPDGTTRPRGAVGKYLTYGDAQSERAVTEVLNAADPARAADELISFVGNDPKALEGARAAFWQKLESASRSVDATQKDMAGNLAWRGDWLKRFLDDPRTSAVADRFYADSPDHLAAIRQYADVLSDVDLRVRAKAPGSSGTAQGVNSVLTPETLQSRIYAMQRGAIGPAFFVTSIAAVVARRAVSKAREGAIDRLTAEVLLNPEAAVVLLRENNPATRAILERRAKTWFGNEAATILDLLNGDESQSTQQGYSGGQNEPLKITVTPE